MLEFLAILLELEIHLSMSSSSKDEFLLLGPDEEPPVGAEADGGEIFLHEAGVFASSSVAQSSWLSKTRGLYPKEPNFQVKILTFNRSVALCFCYTSVCHGYLLSNVHSAWRHVSLSVWFLQCSVSQYCSAWAALLCLWHGHLLSKNKQHAAAAMHAACNTYYLSFA